MMYSLKTSFVQTREKKDLWEKNTWNSFQKWRIRWNVPTAS